MDGGELTSLSLSHTHSLSSFRYNRGVVATVGVKEVRYR